MDLLLDVLTALGVGVAVGVRPFVATIAVGVLALVGLGVDFDGTDLEFLSAPWFLPIPAVLLAASIARRPPDIALVVLSVLLGALLGGAIIDDREDTWITGLAIGAAGAGLAAAVAGEVFGRVRTRLEKSGDASLLPAYGEVIGLALAVLSVLVPFFGVVALALVVWFGLQQRKRADQKYAGLRILR